MILKILLSANINRWVKFGDLAFSNPYSFIALDAPIVNLEIEQLYIPRSLPSSCYLFLDYHIPYKVASSLFSIFSFYSLSLLFYLLLASLILEYFVAYAPAGVVPAVEPQISETLARSWMAFYLIPFSVPLAPSTSSILRRYSKRDLDVLILSWISELCH